MSGFIPGMVVRVAKGHPLRGCVGVVVAGERGYCDSKYVFVLPLRDSKKRWPPKIEGDPHPYWHFLPSELEA